MYKNSIANKFSRAMGLLPVDKQLHGLWSFFLTMALAVAFPILVAAGLALGAGIAWELITRSANTMREHLLDAAADAVGVITACALVFYPMGI